MATGTIVWPVTLYQVLKLPNGHRYEVCRMIAIFRNFLHPGGLDLGEMAKWLQSHDLNRRISAAKADFLKLS